MSTKKQEQTDSIASLREWLADGDTVYTVLRSVSRSGMSRDVSVHIIRDGHPLTMTFHVSRTLGWRLKRGFTDSVVVRGCGMDIGFHLVDCLSRAIGRKLKHHWL